MKLLCISDLHARPKTIRHINTYVESLSSFLKKKNFDEQIDYLTICGDVAFSGKTEEYDLAKSVILDLMRSCNLSMDNVLMVPGNHDMTGVKGLSYKEVTDYPACCCPVLRMPFKDLLENKIKVYNDSVENLFDMVLSNTVKCKSAMTDYNVINVFRNYSAFRGNFLDENGGYESVLGIDDIKYVCGIRVFERDKVVFVELNSSWKDLPDVSPHNSQFGGSIIDKMSIEIEPYRRKGYIVVTLFHHPFRCLEEKEYVSSPQYQVYDQILKMSDVCLSGHVHGQDAKEPDLLGNRCQFIQLGGFCSIDYVNAKYESSAAIINIDMVGRRIGVQHLTYNSNEWKCDPSYTYYDLWSPSLNDECNNGIIKWVQDEISDEKHRKNIIYKYLNPCSIKKETDNSYTVHVSEQLIFYVQFYDLEKDKDILATEYPRLIILYHCSNETKYIQLKEKHKVDIFCKKMFFILEKDWDN